MRRILLAVTLTVALAAGATTANAQGFSGPWDSAHEPPTITNAGVTTGIGGTFTASESFLLSLSPSVWCSNGQLVPITVTFSDPDGSRSVSAFGPVPYEEEPCSFNWTESEPGPESSTFNFSIFGGGRSLLSATSATVPFKLNGTTTPFFYQVSGPSGVIAQAAMTATFEQIHHVEPRTTHNNDVTQCEREHLDIRSGTNGELYCLGETESSVVYEYSFSQGGWPAPVPPEPEPKPEPAPTYPALTRATAGYWVKTAVEFHFHYVPTQFRATRCTARSRRRYRCNVSWRHGSYSFVGTVEVGSVNTHTAKYTYGLRVVRTDVRTQRRHTFTAAY